MTEPTSTSSTTRRRPSPRSSPRPRGAARRSASPAATRSATRLRAGGRARARLEQRVALVGRRPRVPPDDERSNFLLAKRTLLDRIERQPRCTGSAASSSRPVAALEYDEALDGVDARPEAARPRPGRPRRLAVSGLAAARRARAPRDERPGRPRAVRRPGDDDGADDPLGEADRVPRHRRRQGRRRHVGLPRRDRRARARQPAPPRARRRSTSTSTAPRPRSSNPEPA